MASAREEIPPPLRERHARYCIRCLFVSVLPAPLSPETTMDWLQPVFVRRW